MLVNILEQQDLEMTRCGSLTPIYVHQRRQTDWLRCFSLSLGAVQSALSSHQGWMDGWMDGFIPQHAFGARSHAPKSLSTPKAKTAVYNNRAMCIIYFAGGAVTLRFDTLTIADDWALTRFKWTTTSERKICLRWMKRGTKIMCYSFVMRMCMFFTFAFNNVSC